MADRPLQQFDVEGGPPPPLAAQRAARPFRAAVVVVAGCAAVGALAWGSQLVAPTGPSAPSLPSAYLVVPVMPVVPAAQPPSFDAPPGNEPNLDPAHNPVFYAPTVPSGQGVPRRKDDDDGPGKDPAWPFPGIKPFSPEPAEPEPAKPAEEPVKVPEQEPDLVPR